MKLLIILLALATSIYFLLRRRRRNPRTPTTEPMSTLALERALQGTLEPNADKKIPGRRTILVSSTMAFLSLFLSWGDFLFTHNSGFSIGAWAISLAWIYPLIAAKNSWRLHAPIAKLCAISSMIAGLVILAAVSSRTVAFISVSPGAGIFIYLLFSIFLYSGVARYAKAHSFRPSSLS